MEHIVVDGGSTDGTLDVIKSFRSRHDLRWTSGSDAGMYDAINKGLEMATGDVLCYVNSDDFYLPWTLDVAVRAFQDGADFVFGDLGVLQVRDDGVTKFFIQFYPSFDLTHYTHVSSLGQPTVFWTRAAFEKIGGFDTTYKLIGDCEYWVRAGTQDVRFQHVDEVLAIQVDHGDTLRATRPQQLRAEFERMRGIYRHHAPPPGRPRWSQRKKSLRWRFTQLALTLESRRSRPKRWPRFIAFLREHDIEVITPARAAASLLPSKLRPAWAMRVDKSRVEGKLMEAIGADGSA